MDIRLLSELLLLRARWRRRDQWDAGRIATHQERALGDLRRAAYAHASVRGGRRLLAVSVVSTLRLDATEPLSQTVSALNSFQPRLLVGSPSALRPLAAEQRAGRLSIAPQSVMSASEVLSEQAAAEMLAAWGSAPLDVYASTETAGIASPCSFHNRHIYEETLSSLSP